MNTLTKRYQAMPDELLLKTLIEREKYSEAAVAVAISEAEARGLAIPQAAVAGLERKDNRIKEFLRTAQIADQAGKNEDLLDSDVIRKGVVANKLALKLMVWGFVLLFALDLVDKWEYFGVLRYGFDWSSLLLFVPVIFTVVVVAGIWKGIRPAFYLGAGMITLAALGWLVGIYSLFRDPPSNDYGGFFDSFFYEYHTVFSFWFLLMILKLVVLIGTGWLLCQPPVYQRFGMKQNTVALAFVVGALVLFFVNYLVISMFDSVF
ncbi:MAG: hypothetical protein AB8H12_03150 [Lewinella sp.]